MDLAETNSRGLLHGPGWRLGYQPQQPFVALVGGDQWAIELTDQEWQDFCQGLQSLQSALEASQAFLMDQETITLDHCTDMLQLIVTGYTSKYSLYLKLLMGRRVEGIWDFPVIPKLLLAIDDLNDLNLTERE